MGFSKHGDNGLLATVSTDNEHTVNIWNWRDCNVDGVDVPLASGIGKQGTPPQVRLRAVVVSASRIRTRTR